LSDKVLPWICLIIGGPFAISVIGAVAGIQPFQHGDLYVYDLGLLLAGAAETIAEPGAPDHATQGAWIATLLFGVALSAQWVATTTGREGHTGGQWWVAVSVTVVIAIAASACVYIGAIGSANSEVKRWNSLS
jgi:hypothetical protein